MATVKPGDAVQWSTPQGTTHGTVTKKIVGSARAGGHVAHATPAEPQFEVKSAKTGKTAIHKPAALKKTGKTAPAASKAAPAAKRSLKR